MADQEELNLFRDNVRRFVQNEMLPYHQQWEKDGMVPREFWNRMGDNFLLCVDVPEEYGGIGASFIHSMIVAEEISRYGCAGFCGGLTVHSDIVVHYILNSGTEEQKQYYLPKMVTGELVGAIGMTEPGAGSDLQGIRTRAVRDGDDWVINGSKTFISNGQHCDFVVLVTKTNPDVRGSRGTSLFIVDKSAEGFEKGTNLDKIGQHSADTSELFFEDVRVPGTALLGSQDGGFAVMMNELPRERLSLAAVSIAGAEGVMAETVTYVKERKAFGKAIAELQNTRFKMAEMETDVRMGRAFVNECLERYQNQELDNASASMAKLCTSEILGRVTDGCLQLHGGYGYMTEYPVARAYVDARVQRIYGGTSEIMKELIARDVLK
ncbi:MAG: acyl-CoA dehydrogenase family protein [Endozoicomonas sp.]